MKKYIALIKIGWLDALAYRTEFFVSVTGWGIRLFIGVFLWSAVIEARGGSIGSYSFKSIIIYLLIIQIISSFVFSRVGFDIANDIYRGDFSHFLLKPINYLVLRALHEMSKNIFRTGLGIIIFGTVLIVMDGGIAIPFWKPIVVLIVLMGAYLVNFFIVVPLALSAFWVINSKRFMFIYFGLLSIFSGMIVPIDLFPASFSSLVRFLPFPYIFYLPAKIIQTSTLDIELVRGIALQWMYILVLGIFSRIIYRHGIARSEGVGH